MNDLTLEEVEKRVAETDDGSELAKLLQNVNVLTLAAQVYDKVVCYTYFSSRFLS